MNHVLAWGDMDSGRSVYGFARLWVCSFMGLLVYGFARLWVCSFMGQRKTKLLIAF